VRDPLQIAFDRPTKGSDRLTQSRHEAQVWQKVGDRRRKRRLSGTWQLHRLPPCRAMTTWQPITHVRITDGIVCAQTCCTGGEGWQKAGHSMAGNCRKGGFFFHVDPSTSLAYIVRSTCNFARDKLRVAPSGLESVSTNGSNRPNSQTWHRLAVWTVGALVAGILSKTRV